MVNTVFEQKLKNCISLVLLHGAQRSSAKNDACALVPGASEWMLRYHFPPRHYVFA
jgi:hypothetical protein